MKRFLLLILLTFTTINYSQTKNPFFTYQNRLKFANHLFCSGDYLRAFDEYRTILTQVPNDTLRLFAGISLRKINRFDEAEDYFRALFHFSDLQSESVCEFYKTKFIRGSYNYFFLPENIREPFPENYSRELLKLKYFSLFITDKDNLPDSSKLLSLYPYDEANDISTFYYKARHLQKKNPTTAALLSVVFPGAGKIYTENYSDGISSFVATALFYGLSAWKFSNNKQTAGFILAGIGLFFHVGSVYGSAASAKIYNEQIESKLNSQLIDYAKSTNYFLPDFSPKCKGNK